MERTMENNNVTVIGEIISGFTFSHEVFGEGFYMADLSVNRLSGQADIIPLMVSDRLIDPAADVVMGQTIKVTGQFRSFNRQLGDKRRLELWVFAQEVAQVDGPVSATKSNSIVLDGYVCKAPIYRKTPLGREIADLLLAVNRPYGKSDYIPHIAWGRNAWFVSGFEVGTRVKVWGRVQSREYAKKLNDVECEKRVAYEVSIGRIDMVED